VLLVLVFVLKESLRTKLQSLFWSLSLMVKSLSWFLLLKSLSWSLMKSLCFCPCVQCYFKGNYTLSNAELLTYLLTYLYTYTAYAHHIILLCSSVYSVCLLRRLPWRGFLPHDAMQARPMSSCGVCLSVYPSVCHVRELCQN